MAKYVLKAIDDNADELSASVTYEFDSDHADNVVWHLAQFMRAAGYTWVDSLEIIKDQYPDDDEFNDLDDSEIVDPSEDNMSVTKN